MNRRVGFFSRLFALLMLPQVVWAVDYPISIGNTQLTDGNIVNYVGVGYDDANKTLTLNSVELKDPITWNSSEDFTVYLVGNSTIDCSNADVYAFIDGTGNGTGDLFFTTSTTSPGSLTMKSQKNPFDPQSFYYGFRQVITKSDLYTDDKPGYLWNEVIICYHYPLFLARDQVTSANANRPYPGTTFTQSGGENILTIDGSCDFDMTGNAQTPYIGIESGFENLTVRFVNSTSFLCRGTNDIAFKGTVPNAKITFATDDSSPGSLYIAAHPNCMFVDITPVYQNVRYLSTGTNSYYNSVTGTYEDLVTGKIMRIPWEGTGDANTPFLIKTPEDLNELATIVNSGMLATDGLYFRLTDNLDCQNLTSYVPIGYRPHPSFDGFFDGAGYKILNLNYNSSVIDQNNQDGIGLFGDINVSGTVRNLTLENCTFGGGYCNGAIAEFCNGTIEDCTISSCTISGGRVGGIAGFVWSGSKITNCSVINSTLKDGGAMGGIVGMAEGGVAINYCTVDGCTIITTDEGAGIGGIVENNGATISHCIVKGTNITCGANSAAAAIAPDMNSGIFVGNYYYGDVTVTIGGTTLSGHTQRATGYYDNSQKYVHCDIPVDDGAVLYTKQLTFPAEDAYSSVAEVTGAYYEKIGSTTVTVAPGLMTQLAVTPKSGYVPSETSVTYTPTGGTQQTITPTKAADSYTYSFKMPDADATFALTYAKDLGSNSYSYQIASQDYTGSAIVLPAITMQDPTSVAAIPLTQGTDYNIEGYKDSQKQALNGTPVDAGTYYVTIKGKGNYAGSVDVAFTINQIDLSNVTIAAIGDQTYTGSAIEPAVTVTMNGANVNANEYTIGYFNNTNASTANSLATVTLTSTGKNYTAATTKTATFNIVKAAATVSYATTSISKTFGDAPFTNSLTNTGDGTVTYSSSNTSVATVNGSTGEVIIVGNGSTTITATVTDGANYTYATKTATYTLSVGTAAMTVTATGYAGAYDGQAHGITVTAPDGATVKYGETAGTYNLDASPTYTNAGTYTVYYQVTKANYTTVTGSQTVTISKAAGTINFASVSIGKTFGDAPFTNSLTNTGDGNVTYSSSNTAVATVNATTGEVTIVGNGSTTITATVTDGANYTYATKTASYTLSVGTATMTVSATGYTGAYDGQAHGITVTAPDGATVKYGETAGTYNLDASPTYTNAGTYTVYYQVTMAGFDPVTGSVTVTITKIDATVKYSNYEFTAKIGEPFNPPYLTLDPSDLVVTYYSSDPDVATVDAQTGEVTLVAPGKVNIYAEFAGDANYNSASDYYILTVLQRDIDPIDEDKTVTMNDNDFLTTNDEGQQEEIRLDNTVIYDILYTLNISGDPSESDGYDETEQCVVLNHSMTDHEINRIINRGNEPGSEEYADEYTGLTFKVPAGKGYVIIDSRTDGEHQMMVKIGNLAPVAFSHTGREKDSVLYECSTLTWVYVYNGGKVSNARMEPDHRAKKTKSQVRIYSITRTSSNAAGIEHINSDAFGSGRWYDLQGNRIERPMKKGLYILDGQKVVVR